MNYFLELVSGYFSAGGGVSFILLGIFILITYCVGYRLSILFLGRKVDPRILINTSVARNSVQANFLKSIMGIRFEGTSDLAQKIDWYLKDTYQEIHRYSSILSTAVLLAPLLGLLGTVIGMIETFDSLGDVSLYSSSGGIAGGISQALITTQFGLFVAVPGLLFSRYLNKVEKKTYHDTLQLKDLYLQKVGEAGVKDE